MAHFYGTVQGNRGQASRLGTIKSGLRATASGWEVGASVTLEHQDTVARLGSQDMLCVAINDGSNGSETLGHFHVACEEGGKPEIRFVHKGFFRLFTEQAWQMLFEDEQFMREVRQRLLPNIEKVQRA